MNQSSNPDIDAPTEAGDKARREVGGRLVRENEKAWQPPGVHLGYVYDPSPIVVPDGTPRPADDTHGYTPTTYPGARAPHFWLRTDVSTLDLFGGGFVLMKFEDVDTAELEEAAKLRRVPLEVHYVANEKVASLYERLLVLVRPDGHVAWRGDALPNNCLDLIDTVRGAGARIIACRGTTRSTTEVTRPTLVSTFGRTRHG
jgi:hypothetical protein